MIHRLASAFGACLFALLIAHDALGADTAKKPEAPESKAENTIPEGKVFVTHHKGRVGAAAISYTATAGTMQMKNDKDEPVALFGFTAYARDGVDPRTRPIVFAYNGGPGSASAWLHMGILGPKRTVIDDLAYNTRGPFRIVENEYSILDVADLVMIDPIGTGFSRTIGKGEGKDFWGVDQDVTSVSNFIVQYLSEYGRWSSPKFILGESYGGMRTGGVSFALLTRHNVALNGVILVSPYMDVAAGFAGLRVDEPYVNFLPTFASTAWYQHALKDRPEQLQPFLREVEAFSEDVYAPVLFKGTRATAAERQAVLTGLERYTGISAAYWDKANLRLDEGRFLQELMRNKGKVIGRVDSRYVGDTVDPLSESMRYDPYSAAIAPAIVATFNDYYREDLKVESDREYILSGDLWMHWDDSHAQPDLQGFKSPFANTAVDLAQALTMNPKMQVLIQQGYFDLAVPYRTIQYVVEHLDVAPELRANVHFEYYDAGHMMYVHPPSMKKFKDTTSDFIHSNVN
ncbi:S10 family peptidase [Dokdonella immobilis]|uniref:Carboxypeptidase C (Cathepsin A) n=1 Tax=Dokdonella immobilis TaxID=578942 RepID=A0A1I5ASF9_9GAMM|nr:carboxypeptidase [Dokdonella immobilis]SFN65391.1 Carboxypeptidase C (cathepsin A) [Dokdonella immobilis]